eukprot:tig00000802_g4303.t1
MSVDPKELLSAAKEVAREAGALVREAINRPKNIDTKSSGIDLVTETDRRSEEIVFSRLRAKFPTHIFIGEESAESTIQLTDAPTWIVDPIDGTTNFVHSWPEVAVCVACAVKQQVVAGVCYNPCTDEMYWAVRGGGAFLNERPIRVSAHATIDKSIVMTEYGYNRTKKNIDINLAILRRLMERNMQAMRMSGSGALDLCYIARGICEGIYAWGWKAWDYAAASLILEEAGGALSDPRGGPFSILGPGIVAGNEHIAPQLLAIVREAEAEVGASNC